MGVLSGSLRQLHIGGLAGIEDLVASRRQEGEEVYADRQLVVARTRVPIGLRFKGEIDASNAEAVVTSLASAHAKDGEVHLDLSALMFIDISGIRAFITAGENAVEDRRLLLHGLPDQLERVINVVGWDQLPGLSICKCGVEQA